ncbi:MAG: ferrous iron transport protein A [Lachnospiraceae bacterium]|nr:ferrous iron transport protein A [Lachnospiraceae bacterium]MBQ9233011.1 ferrous iron transport protein A [Lachnospiraceae bacterium]MBQ9278415.1 ferrous iron transport protein A [Lachnospiraceae bacterium]
MMNLTELKKGERAMIVQIDGDRRYLSRVTSIGLNVGCKVEMLQNVKKKPLLIYGRDTMIALNREESERIKVEVSA